MSSAFLVAVLLNRSPILLDLSLCRQSVTSSGARAKAPADHRAVPF